MLKKRKLQLVSVLMAMLISSQVLASCGGETTETTSGAQETETAVETVPEETDYKADYLPDVKYDGYSYRIIDYEEYPMHIAEPSGDIVDDAIYERNLKVAEKYDIKFTPTTYRYADYNKVAELITTAARAQSDDFDLATVVFKAAYNAVIAGYVPAASNLPIADFTKPWYLKNINNSMYLDNTYLLGYTTFDLNAGGRGVIFNKNIITDLGLDDPYTLVKEGKWVYETMYKMAEAAISDVDGNGTMDGLDRYGIIASPDNFADFAYTGSGYLLVTIEDGIPVMSQDEKLFEVFMKASSYIQVPGLYLNVFKQFGQTATAGVEGLDFFKQGHGLFSLMGSSYITTMGDMEDDYGLLPIPKWTEEQAEYYACQDGSRIGLPLSCATDLERTMVIKEALAVESLNITYPAYYENAMKNRYVRDEESIEMLEIITAGVTLDLGQNPWWDIVRQPWMDTLIAGKDSYASAVAAKIKTFESTVDELMEKIAELKASN